MIGLLAWAYAQASPAVERVPSPDPPTLVYYNARLALREGRPAEAVKLWWLRNALVYQSRGRASAYDEDFVSVTWASLGALGVCPDGLARDEDGAGLWPLALHNWVVRNMNRSGPAGRPRVFEAYELGRQARLVSIDDVLSADELRTVDLVRGACLRPRLALLDAGESPTARLSDRQVTGRLLQALLRRALETLSADAVHGRAVVEARLFDLDLQLAALAAREAQQRAQRRAERGRAIGLSRGSVAAVRADGPATTLAPDSEPARILTECASWPIAEWMALSEDRRRFLFDRAREYGGDAERWTAVALGIVDALIAERDGAQVEEWIARSGDAEAVWSGERGRRLLDLDRESGFREGAVIALHRGVALLAAGDQPGALRAIAAAAARAGDSRAAEPVASLSTRWLSYVASQFAITEELLVTLKELVGSQAYTVLLEDLMWHAAFRADRASFERGAGDQAGALSRRLALLRPLASGDVGRFAQGVREGLARSPNETLRFVRQWVERLEREDAEVRTTHVPAVVRLRALVRDAAEEEGANGRLATTILDRTQALLDGVGGEDAAATARERARAFAPGAEVFAGSVRLAPSDALPWPFVATAAAAPSVYTSIELTPVEWQTDGGWVFGWQIRG